MNFVKAYRHKEPRKLLVVVGPFCKASWQLQLQEPLQLR